MLPDWLEQYIQDTRRLFGIGDDWYIVVKLVPAPDNDVSKEGYCELNIRYRTAKIYLNSAMEEDGLRHTSMHELLHVALAPLEINLLRVLDLVPEELRLHAQELFADGTEQSVETLTRALQRTIKPKRDDEQTKETHS